MSDLPGAYTLGVRGPATVELNQRLAEAKGPGRGWASPGVAVIRDYVLEAAGLDAAELSEEAAYAVSVLATDVRVDLAGGIASLVAVACEKAARR